jgi:hypothetical protein
MDGGRELGRGNKKEREGCRQREQNQTSRSHFPSSRCCLKSSHRASYLMHQQRPGGKRSQGSRNHEKTPALTLPIHTTAKWGLRRLGCSTSLMVLLQVSNGSVTIRNIRKVFLIYLTSVDPPKVGGSLLPFDRRGN